MGESYTIQISSNLVNKLSSDRDKTKKKTPKSKAKVPERSEPSQGKVLPNHSTSFPNMHKGSSPNGGWPHQSPLFLPTTPSPPLFSNELDAIRSTLRESESILEKLEKKEANMVQEVTQRAKELHEKEFKLPYQQPMPCLAEKDACLECYKENAKDPLKCANVVKSFSDCVRIARQQEGS